MRRIAVLATLFVLAFPAVAGATIFINRSMFGVSLGATMKQVRGRFGRPDTVGSNSRGPVWRYVRRGFLLTFSSKTHRVIELFTANPHQRTPGGLGVGSTEKAVKRHVRGIQCRSVAGLPGIHCVILNPSHTRGTDFHVTSGRVDNVFIEIVA